MNNKNTLKKIIKTKLTPFSKKYNFKFYKPTILIRECESILQIINFDLLADGFNCNIALQPLYIPNEDLILSFGNRLNHFKTREEGIWGYGNNQEEVEKDIERVIELLEINAVPWFNEVSTASDIIKFLHNVKANKSDIIINLPPQMMSKVLGYSYLYKGEYSSAKDSLEFFIEFYKEDTRKWVIDEVGKIKELMNISESNPSNILSMLTQYTKFTKKNLNIKL